VEDAGAIPLLRSSYRFSVLNEHFAIFASAVSTSEATSHAPLAASLLTRLMIASTPVVATLARRRPWSV
jgi:hypothetical protein